MSPRFHSFLLRMTKLVSIIASPPLLERLARFRVAAAVEHGVVLSQLDDCRAVVDIGANRGQFALAARHHLPRARIDSFEPLSGPADVFRQVFAGDADTHLHEAAVGPRQEQATLHVSGRDDSSSLLPITTAQTTLFAGTGEKGLARVRVAPLRDFLHDQTLAAPALLKIDVQGFELQALEGCESMLPQFAWVYVECSFIELYAGQAFADEVIAWLRSRGFRLCGVFNMTYAASGLAIQADFLFTSRAR